MPVLYAPETEYAKEAVKWEAYPTQMGPGKRPFVHRDYPTWIYKAGRPENGLGPHCIVESQIANTPEEAARYHSAGFRMKPLEAIEAFEAQQLEFAKLAAEINYDVKKKLSPNAAAEVIAFQESHPGHQPTIPETPIKKRGRKAKVKE